MTNQLPHEYQKFETGWRSVEDVWARLPDDEKHQYLPRCQIRFHL